MKAPISLRFHDLEIGDCVRLRSSGPLMLVVAAPTRDRHIAAVWPNGQGGTYRDIFKSVTVELIAKGYPI